MQKRFACKNKLCFKDNDSVGLSICVGRIEVKFHKSDRMPIGRRRQNKATKSISPAKIPLEPKDFGKRV